MTTWFKNLDGYARQTMPTLALTRNRPPDGLRDAHLGVDVDAVADLAPEQEIDLTTTHEAAHAVVYMAAGHTLESITIHPVPSRGNKATVVKNGGNGPWQEFAVCFAIGERAADRRLREMGLWTPTRAWAMERLAGDDRALTANVVAEVFGRDMTYGVSDEPSDYSWICNRADEALDKRWRQIRALAQYLVAHPSVTGTEAARAAGF